MLILELLNIIIIRRCIDNILRGSAFNMKCMKIVAAIYYALTGWKVEGFISPEMKRCIVVIAPHTSNYDFLFARMAFFLQERPGYFFIKIDYMFVLLKPILKTIGAIGVDRSKSTNMVDQIVDLMNGVDDFILGITPEGTRSFSQSWKTGFYQIALDAKVPIVLMYLDYRRKAVGVAQILEPSGDLEADMEIIEDLYKTIHPRHPEKYNPKIFTSTELNI